MPWPKFAVDLDEVKRPRRLILSGLGFVAMLGLTGLALVLYIRYHAIFFVNLNFPEPRLFFTPEAGKWFSLAVIATLAVGTIALFVKLFASSPWVDVVKDGISLIIVGWLFRLPLDNAIAISLPGRFLHQIKFSLTFILFFISVVVAVDFVKSLVVIGRKGLAKQRQER